MELIEKTPYDKLNLARHKDRPTSLDYINFIFDDFLQFHGDRRFGDDKAVVGGIAKFCGKPVTIIGIQKGRDVKERIDRNFGMPKPEGYRKALRLMLQAEKFKRPVICFIDTPGAYCGVDAEERGQGQAIAENLMMMSDLRTPIISIIIGEGGSGGALALAVSDRVFMMENSIYSILSPEGFASILWKDSSRVVEAASVMKITAQDLLELKVIDGIIKEPKGGAHEDLIESAQNIKEVLKNEVEVLSKKPIKKLIKNRYTRFRGF